MVWIILAVCALTLFAAILVPEVREALLTPVAALAMLLFVATLLIGRSYWHEHEEHAAPDGAARVRIESKPNLADFQMRVRLDAGSWEEILYQTQADWCGPSTAIAWSAQSSQVAVFATDPCGPRLLVGYDLQLRRALTAVEAEALILPELQKRFGWQPSGPLLEWLQSKPGRDAARSLR